MTTNYFKTATALQVVVFGLPFFTRLTVGPTKLQPEIGEIVWNPQQFRMVLFFVSAKVNFVELQGLRVRLTRNSDKKYIDRL